RSQSPLGDVEGMSAPAAEEADRVVVRVEGSLALHAVVIVGSFRSGTEPGVVFEILRLRLRNPRSRIQPLRRATPVDAPGVDALDLTQIAVPNELDRVAELASRSLLRAVLEHALVPSDGFAKLLRPREARAQRLLDVHVLPALGGVIRKRDVPVVARAADDRIDIV